MSTIAERISAKRREQFVGRTEELELFRKALSAEEDILLLHVHAPAGVGKTSLLRQFQNQCSPDQSIWLDGKNIQPTTDGFLTAFKTASAGASAETDAAPGRPLTPDGRTVCFIDEYDALNPLDGWFRDSFVPDLPEDALIVLAGRLPLPAAWQTDSAWQRLSRTLSLRNLNDAEQRQYLVSHGVPPDQQDAVIEFTRGHPLALSLVTANRDQNAEMQFDPEAFPDVIKMLLERFIDSVPSPLHRKALEASSLVRVTTEGLLAQLVDAEKSYELFEWLRSLSFTEVGPEGVSPKDLAREAISLEMRWRNPDWHAELHHRARRYYTDHLERSRGAAHQAIVSDYIYLHRDNPTVKPFFDWGFAPVAYFDSYRPEDNAELLSMTARHEGVESAEILELWLQRQPENAVVLRSSGSDGGISGFLVKLQLQSLSEEDLRRDPGAAAASRHLASHAPLRKGEVATIFRSWMDREAHQSVSPIQSLIFVAMVQYSLSQPNLAHTFIPCVQPDFWLPMFSYAALKRLEHADFDLGGQHYGMFGHDWRALTPHAWLDLLSEREIQISAPSTEAPRLPDIVLLSRQSFDDAVHEALKSFNNSSKLVTNPLLRSRVVTAHLPNDAAPAERLEALRTTIREQANSWRVSGRDAKLYDALEHGYIRPAATQDKAAELVDVSIATFRRHLKAAEARLSDGLWDIEIGG